jgi:hypothetical protein
MDDPMTGAGPLARRLLTRQATTTDVIVTTFEACPGLGLPPASRSLLAAGPGGTVLRDAVARVNDEFRAALRLVCSGTG